MRFPSRCSRRWCCTSAYRAAAISPIQYSTTLAYRSSSEESISLTGWLVRDEVPLQGPSGTLQQMLREGEKAAAGETVVTVYSNAGALDTVSRIREQELQLEQLQFALESYLDSDAALKLDSSITDSILTLRGELADGDYSTASENVSALKAAILKRSHSYSSSEEIQSRHRSGRIRALAPARLALWSRQRQGREAGDLQRRLRRLRGCPHAGHAGGSDGQPARKPHRRVEGQLARQAHLR